MKTLMSLFLLSICFLSTVHCRSGWSDYDAPPDKPSLREPSEYGGHSGHGGGTYERRNSWWRRGQANDEEARQKEEEERMRELEERIRIKEKFDNRQHDIFPKKYNPFQQKHDTFLYPRTAPPLHIPHHPHTTSQEPQLNATTILPVESEENIVTIIPSEGTQSTSQTSPTLPSFPPVKAPTGRENPPVVLPVTTEGKSQVKAKTEDPLLLYGIPKELLPILPGGGSRFDDVEREKLERKKMSQTKGGDDEPPENGGSHDAEGLYSSASLSSLSLCCCHLTSFLLLGTRLV